MESRKLYIIGNGFDLWHRIPSHYWQFKEFVRGHDAELLKAVEDYLPVDEDWCELESALAEIDVGSITDDLEHFMTPYGANDWSDSSQHNFQYEVDRVVERLSTELRRRFGQWIRQLPIPTTTTATQRLQTIDPTAHFLTFNYTSTLLVLYGVPDTHVLHIHGRADLAENYLILGHGWNPKDRHSLNDRPGIEDIDTRLMEAHTILDRYFSKTFKPSAQLIEEHRPFFDRLVDVEEIFILGHSLSDVDELYFRALLTIPSIASARWRLACRPEDDNHKKNVRLQELGVQASNIIICSWSEV